MFVAHKMMTLAAPLCRFQVILSGTVSTASTGLAMLTSTVCGFKRGVVSESSDGRAHEVWHSENGEPLLYGCVDQLVSRL